MSATEGFCAIEWLLCHTPTRATAAAVVSSAVDAAAAAVIAAATVVADGPTFSLLDISAKRLTDHTRTRARARARTRASS